MATLSQLKKAAQKVGATVTKERIGLSTTCRVEAPYRMIWCEGFVHQMVDEVYTGPNDYADLISRMEYGLQQCDDPECDWCLDREAEMKGEERNYDE